MQIDVWSILAMIIVIVGVVGGVWYEHSGRSEKIEVEKKEGK